MTSTWIPDPQSFATWGTEGVDHQRITEAGRIRVTEQGAVIRIIERFIATWNDDPPLHNTWT